MEANTSSPILIDEKKQEKLLWHKPEVKRLSISFDTASFVQGNSSMIDFIGG